MSLIGNYIRDIKYNEIPVDGRLQTQNDTDISKIQVKAKIKFTIYDSNGKIVKEWEEPSKSLTFYYAVFEYNMWSQGSYTMIDTSGASVVPNMGSPGVISVNAGSGINTYGIVVGSGNTSNVSVKSTIVSLIAPIPNGSGAGQLLYQNVSFGNPTVSQNTASWTLSRNFINQSGGTINITEIGIIAYVSGFGMVYSTSSTPINTDYFLFAYDIPSSAITIINGQTLNIIYTFTVVA